MFVTSWFSVVKFNTPHSYHFSNRWHYNAKYSVTMVNQQIHKIHIWIRLWQKISQTLLLAAYVLVFCFLNCMSCFARILHPSWLPSFANFLISSSWNRDNAVTYTAQETETMLLHTQLTKQRQCCYIHSSRNLN